MWKITITKKLEIKNNTDEFANKILKWKKLINAFNWKYTLN